MEIIIAKYFLPMTNGAPIERDSGVAFELNRIVDTGSRAELLDRYPNAEVKEFSTSVLMPGIVNSHCHLDITNYTCKESEDFEPEVSPDELIDYLIASINYKETSEQEDVIPGMQRAIKRLIETGVTSVGEVSHYEVSFKLLKESGLRGVVFPEVVAGQFKLVKDRFEVALALVDKHLKTSDARVQVGIGPHSPYTLSRQLLKVISQHAKEASIPVQIHAAESFAEMEFFFDSQGPIANSLFPSLGWRELPPQQMKTPVQYLSDIGFLEAPVTIIGGLHLSKQDFPLLSRNLTHVVYCPTFNKRMKLGNLPYGKLVKAGIPIGIGTEAWHGRLGFNMWDELRSALESGATPNPSALELMKMATIGGARVLHLDHVTGTLEKGKKADFIIISEPEIEDEVKLYEELIRNTSPQHISMVVVNGKILKQR